MTDDLVKRLRYDAKKRMEEPAENPYAGKYQNQAAGPQGARDER